MPSLTPKQSMFWCHKFMQAMLYHTYTLIKHFQPENKIMNRICPWNPKQAQTKDPQFFLLPINIFFWQILIRSHKNWMLNVNQSVSKSNQYVLSGCTSPTKQCTTQQVLMLSYIATVSISINFCPDLHSFRKVLSQWWSTHTTTNAHECEIRWNH